MKKTLIFIRNHWSVMLIALLILSNIGLYLWVQNIKQKTMLSDEAIKAVHDEIIEPVISTPKEGGGNIVSQKVNTDGKTVSLSSYQKVLNDRFIKDTIIAALEKKTNVDKVTIQNYARLVGEAAGKLTKKDLIIDSLNKTNENILEWKNNWMWAKSDFEKKTLDYKYNLDIFFLQGTEKSKGFLGTGLFPKKQDYMIGTSRDSSATFSGIQYSKTPIKERKDLFNLSAEIGGHYFLKPYNQLAVYGGIRGTVNPDGRFQPSIGGMYYFNPFTREITPVVDLKLSYTIFE